MDFLSSLTRAQPGRTRRVSSYDVAGGNEDYHSFGPHQTYTLADIAGAGIIRHIWITIDCKKDPLWRKNVVIRAYWDGQDFPSVEAPIGDFFGQGWGEFYDFSSLPLAAAPKDGRALVCYFAMPFANGARITLENQGDAAIERVYFYVDYDELSSLPDSELRFCAWYNQELTRPESPDCDLENEWSALGPYQNHPSTDDNYVFLETEGAGHFVGVNYYINNPGPMWYGEGDDMFLVDGESWPGIHGTGTEDYFNTAWSPDTLYSHPFFGIARAPGRNDPKEPRFGWMGRTHVYRFHLADPIRFTKSLHASIEHGHANCLTLELASVAYWYQTPRRTPFPALAAAIDRLPRPTPSVTDVHLWRHAHRQSHGGGSIWGTEP